MNGFSLFTQNISTKKALYIWTLHTQIKPFKVQEYIAVECLADSEKAVMTYDL